MNNQTTIGEVIKAMQEATTYINGTRVKVGEIHGGVMKAINPIAEAVDLECRSCWDITYKEGYGRTETIIKYNTDLKRDMRYKWDTIGKINKLVFSPAHEYISLDDTVEEAVTKVKYHNAQDNLKRLQAQLDELYIDVEKFKGWINETIEEMNQLRDKVKR